MVLVFYNPETRTFCVVVDVPMFLAVLQVGILALDLAIRLLI